MNESQAKHGTPEFFEFDCPSCNTRLKVARANAGKQARCPHCQAVVDLPHEQPAAVAGTPTQGTRKAPDENAEHPNTPVDSGLTPGPGENPTKRPDTSRDTPTRQLYLKITAEISKLFVGQEELVQGTLVALFSGGHVLIESVPGLGKTLFVRTLAQVLGCEFGRIQFTADLMPSDVTGAPIYNMKTQEFDFRPGPVFTQLLLADEINRSPAKTHAALLEIMQEKNVTVDGTTHQLAPPFLVMATQNPIESEGTYNLPEAQLDRFMFKLVANYPTEEQEVNILQLHGGQSDLDERLSDDIQRITNPAEIVDITRKNSTVTVDPSLVDYINKIVRKTRTWPAFYMGASPRAGIALIQGARTLAAFHGRDYAVPDDVVEISLSVLRHRVMLTAEAEVEGQNVDQLLGDLIRTVEVPRSKN
ncbi:MAG: AAA family ATPase [Mariniblastus sp.]|nr:AAA family ATPase [Mariniblastus sp.]